MRPAPQPESPAPLPQQSHFPFTDLSDDDLRYLIEDQYEREQTMQEIHDWDEVDRQINDEYQEALEAWQSQLYLDLGDVA